MTNPLTEKGEIWVARMIGNQPVEGRAVRLARLATPTPRLPVGVRPPVTTPGGAGRAEDCLPLGVRPSGLSGKPEARR